MGPAAIAAAVGDAVDRAVEARASQRPGEVLVVGEGPDRVDAPRPQRAMGRPQPGDAVEALVVVVRQRLGAVVDVEEDRVELPPRPLDPRRDVARVDADPRVVEGAPPSSAGSD